MAFRAPPLAVASCLLVALAPGAARAQIPGENVNMVSGTQWPGGDPYLQRQNEPSIAVSAANPLHLLAAANDYRTVDIPNPGAADETGDAWLGLFKSFDGGQTWRSTLLAGYPQDTSAAGLASPIHGLKAAADPTVRAGPGGLLYLSGIAFNRGTNIGKVFLARFLDRNNKENGDPAQNQDPILYLDARAIDSGTSGQFVDKPFIAVDVPRNGSAACSAGGAVVPAGNVYFAYATFTGTNQSSSKVMFTRSTDCGATWDAPQKLSESNGLNQGAVIAVDPASGAVYVAWRRFATSSETDAIVIARSTDLGSTFTKGGVVANLAFPFEQGSGTAFRTEALPTLAISVAADPSDPFDTSRMRSWVHLAWSQRPAASADAQVVVTTSADGLTWPAPTAVDPVANDPDSAYRRGHQLMPALTSSQGRLVLLYYDSRLDHTRGYFRPRQPFVPDLLGRFYTELRGPMGELVDSPSLVYTPLIDDLGLGTRHTLEVRVATAAPGASPAFSTARVSQYRVGTRGDEVPGLTAPGFGGPLQVVDPSGAIQLLQELQLNPPNLPMFAQGTLPFIGDYIDIQGPMFVTRPGGGWAFAVAPTASPVFHAVWTSNQDVRPPPDGNWARFTPPGGGGASVFDPTQSRSACVTGYEGTRNQNIYTSRITDGLVVTSPQNVKPLSATLTRAFVVGVANTSDLPKAVRFSVGVPAGVTAQFRNDGVLLGGFDVAIPKRSSISRALFVRLETSSDVAATVTVRVDEVIPGPSCSLAAQTCPLGSAAGFVTLNPPGSNPQLLQPDGTSDPISSIEIYVPTVGAASVTNANVTNANVTNANVTNASVTNANVTNASVTNTHLANPDLANVTNANVTNANVTNANVTNASVTNASVTNANVTNAPLSDATYTVTNTGNTTHSYNVTVVGTAPTAPLQLIVSRSYTNPVALNCQLLEEPRDVVVASVDDVTPAVVPSGSFVPDPNIADPRPSNATFALGPGESALVTLRGVFDPAALAQVVSKLAPVVVAHAGASSLFISTDSSSLPTAQVGVSYSVRLQATGGTAPYAWRLASGALPPGLSLAASGQLGGTPTAAGSYAATLGVTDASSPQAGTTRDVTLSVGAGPTTTTLGASPSALVYGQPVTLTATVMGSSAQGPLPLGKVTFLDGAAVIGSAPLSGGVASITVALGVGAHALAAAFASADGNYLGSTTAVPLAVQVGPAATATSLAVAPNPSTPGQAVTLTATVSAVPPGAGTPTGAVTFLDGATPLGSGLLGATGVATLTTSTLGAGSHPLTARYGGDASFSASSSSTQALTVRSPYRFIGFLTPLRTAGSLSAPSYSGPQRFGSAIPLKWQLQTASGAFVTALSAITSVTAYLNAACAGAPPPGSTTLVLYAPASGATGGSTFRYDTGSNQYQFTWDSSSAPSRGCWELAVTLDDGSTDATIVKLQ